MSNQNRRGKQTPRIDIYRRGDTRKAKLLFKLLDEYGTKLLKWQRTVLLRWLAEDEDGNFVNLECGLSVPRQNGKTELIVARVIYGIIFRKAVGLYTAQQDKTAEEVKKRVQDFFYENEHEEIFNLLTPRFRKKPKNYDYIEFETGAYYAFRTRTRLGGLGTTNDDLIFDEAADVLDSHQSTLMSTTSAAKSGNPQIIYAGTPPMAETVGTVFKRIRTARVEGADGAWTEWSTEKIANPLDVKVWYQTNPSLGYFLLSSVIKAESTSLTSDDFNRMRLGWWSGTEDNRAIKQKDWDKLYTEKPEFDDEYKPVYAVKFSQDRSTYALAVAQPLQSGSIHVEIVMSRPMSEGFHRLSKWIIDRWRNCAVIIIDGQTGSPILYEELIDAKIPKNRIIQPTMKDVVAAHQFTRDAIERGELSHYNQPLLNQTVRVTKERAFGRYGGFGWDSMSSALTTVALDACTYALWGQKVHKKRTPSPENQKMNEESWNEILASL